MSSGGFEVPRIAVIPVHLPCATREDIPLLLRHFCAKHGAAAVVRCCTTDALLNITGPAMCGAGNLVERTLILRNGDTLTRADIPGKVLGNESSRNGQKLINLPDDGYPLEELEREIVIEALERSGWNQTAAARFLRIPRHVLLYRMEKYNIPAKSQK
jgi:two-component system NtrC family response regulator